MTDLRFVTEFRLIEGEKEKLTSARAIVHWEGCEENDANACSGGKRCVVWVIGWQRGSLNHNIIREVEHAKIPSTRNDAVEEEISQHGASHDFFNTTIVGSDQFRVHRHQAHLTRVGKEHQAETRQNVCIENRGS